MQIWQWHAASIYLCWLVHGRRQRHFSTLWPNFKYQINLPFLLLLQRLIFLQSWSLAAIFVSSFTCFEGPGSSKLVFSPMSNLAFSPLKPSWEEKDEGDLKSFPRPGLFWQSFGLGSRSFLWCYSIWCRLQSYGTTIAKAAILDTWIAIFGVINFSWVPRTQKFMCLP